MTSRSYTNLLNLATGNFPAIDDRSAGRKLPRTMSMPGMLKVREDESDGGDSPYSPDLDSPSSPLVDRIIIVANQLPLTVTRCSDGNGWSFNWDKDSLLVQLRDGLPDGMEVFHVGCLRADVSEDEHDEVSRELKEKFKCVPVFLPLEMAGKFYQGFCKQHLWPLFHYMLPLAADHGGRFDRELWQAYIAANKTFRNMVMEVLNSDNDYVWIHDYHLMVMPTFLRKKFIKLRIGFFLHCPWPSSEIYRTLPMREEILKALLNTDLIGFHTFDYARHFLSCCSRLLGLEYQCKRGYIGLEYYGRTIGIKIMPMGIHMGQLESVLSSADTKSKISVVRQKFEGNTVLLGVDDMDIFKGINLKVLAMEQMLEQNPDCRGQAVLVQIVNPARGRGREVEEMKAEINASCERLNRQFGQLGYDPVVLIDGPISVSEKIAFYSIAECVVVTAVRDGMNLIPYEYIVCRQGISSSEAKKSMLVVSEFVGCSPSLSGALRINPWNIETTAEAMKAAISKNESEKELRHEKHYKYVSSHDVAYWSRSFMQDMERICEVHSRRSSWGLGFGLGYKVLSLNPNFRKLSIDDIVSAYKSSQNRAIMLDYDGTVMPQDTHVKSPSSAVINILNTLCDDLKNVVFIVSGRGRDNLGKLFSQCEKLGIVAEHGYFLRWSFDEEWETCGQNTSFEWMELAEPVMKLYTESTDGSYIETKETAIVWHHQDADHDFGCAQAKEMLDHLEGVLANEPVAVKSGHHIVEVKPQGVSKGLAADKIISSMKEKGRQADFVLCIGDDRSDEDMFVRLSALRGEMISSNSAVFVCTVGQKPTKAEYYLDDPSEVTNMLQALVDVSDQQSSHQPEPDC